MKQQSVIPGIRASGDGGTSGVTVFLFLLFLLIFSLFFTEPVRGQDGQANVIDVHPGEGIQGVIDNASAGSVIIIHAGNYSESITINTSLTIRGEGARIKGSNADFTILIIANNVEISGLAVEGKDRGIWLKGAENVTLKNLTVSGAKKGLLSAGIRSEDSSHVHLIHVNITDCSSGFYSRSTNHSSITDSTITHNAMAGIYLLESSDFRIEGVNASGNDIGIRALDSEFVVYGAELSSNDRYGSFPEKSTVDYSNCSFVGNDYALRVRESTVKITDSRFLHNRHNFDVDDESTIEKEGNTFTGGEEESAGGGLPGIVYIVIPVVVFALLKYLLPAKKWEELIEKFLMLAGLSSILFVLIIFYFLIAEGMHTFEFVSVKDFLFGKTWNPSFDQNPQYGIAALIVSTFLVTTGAVLLAVPIGVAAAIYLSEFASPEVREFIKPAIELLVGIPSVVYGFFALIILATWLQNWLDTTTRLNALLGSIMLAVMMLPIIISLSEDALRSVPGELKEASLALGATEWETARGVLVPAALSGIIGAVILGIARAVGETMTVLMATGNSPAFTFNMLQSVRTMTATIAIEMGEVAIPGRHYYALFGIGIILFIITFIINLIADVILNRYRERYT